MENCRNRVAALLGAILFLFVLTSCGPGENSVSQTAAVVSKAPESSASGEESSGNSLQSTSPAPESTEEPFCVLNGEITSASKSVLSLTAEDGTLWTVLLNDATEHTGESYVNGNPAAVSYRESETSSQGILAVKVEVSQGKHLSRAETLLAGMTLEEKVGQLFFVRCPDGAVKAVSDYQFGGYILFGRDFDNIKADTVKANIQSYQQNAKIPMLIGVDEEGGTVVRVSGNPDICEEPYWSPRALYNAGGMNLVTAIEQDKVSVLSGLGINVNFAPVCDISQNESDFMYDRSLGRDADTTSEYIRQITGVYQKNNMGCTLKHFPGYGNNRDTHTGIAHDDRSLDTFRNEDFLPFLAGIQQGAGCVLVSHNIVSCVDENSPASLSEDWHKLLREELGFTGCIITDDLSMGAIRDFCDTGSAAVKAVKAGNDLLCCTDYEVQIPAVVAAVQSGEISEGRIEESVLRILSWKSQLGLIAE